MTIGTRVSCALALAVAMSCLLASCSPTPDTQSGVDGAGADARTTFIGRQADKAIARAGEALMAGNIDLDDDFSITVNGRRFGSSGAADGLPRAELTPDGDLLLEGEPGPTTPEQRAMLRAHRHLLEGVALAGLAIGAQGADVAGAALTGIGEALFGGEEGRHAYEARIEAEAARIGDQARKLCDLLPALHESQQALAATLPEFAPYATMTPGDIRDCGQDLEDDPSEALHAATAA